MLRAQDKRLHVAEELGLVVPQHRPIRHETVGVRTAAESFQRDITASASLNTKGSWVEIGSTSSFDADGFYMRCGQVTSNAGFLLDIGIGSAGSEVVILSNVLFHGGSANIGFIEDVYIPLAIPAGTRTAARCQSTDASGQMSVSLRLCAGDIYKLLRLRRATTYGADTTDSGGVSIDPGGSANTKGAWSEISASITNQMRYMIWCIGTQNNSAIGTGYHSLMDIATGAGGSEASFLENIYLNAGLAGDIYNPIFGTAHVEIPSSVRLAARAQDVSTDATDRLRDIVVVGFD